MLHWILKFWHILTSNNQIDTNMDIETLKFDKISLLNRNFDRFWPLRTEIWGEKWQFFEQVKK